MFGTSWLVLDSIDIAWRSAYIFLALWRSELSDITLRLSSATSTMLGRPSPRKGDESYLSFTILKNFLLSMLETL